MTSEPWLPIPYDDTPYENGPLVSAAPLNLPPTGLTAGAAEPSAPVPSPLTQGPTPAGALPLCPNCLTEVDEDLYCGGCGRQLPIIDRGSRAAIQEDPRAAEGDPC